ncbi:MAG: DUF1080 domain-containing protein [Bryobacteraceae bacterium]|nr:DUF1080 domain-containing protein [Bryobacteraceae bacterium]
MKNDRTFSLRTLVGGLGIWAVAAASAAAQPGGRVPPGPDDLAGFVSIFDGKSLEGWDGDPRFWRVEGGAIVAESTPEKVVERNTFLIWKGGPVGDFELKLEFKLSDTANSGVQYRSATVSDLGPWALKGYQADMDGQNRFTGMVYEERGRGFLAERGQFVRIADGKVRKMIGSPGDPESLKALLRPGDWNQLHVIARGTVLIHVVNGRVMALLVDDDAEGRSMQGLLGLQLHAGKPMRIEFRNIYLKKL